MDHWYEALFRRVLLPAYESPLRGRRTLEYIDQYRRNEALSADELAAMQWQQLQQMLQHCWDDVPFYRKRWSELDIHPRDIRSLDDFRRLPLLKKADIRDNFESLQARSLQRKLLFKRTDGTTGEPLRFGYTRDDYERRNALMYRGYRWSGYDIGTRTLYLWWSPQLEERGWNALRQRLHHRLFNRSVLNTMHLNRENMEQYARRINRLKPNVIVSYVMPLYLLSRWAREHGIRLHTPRVILTAAEPLEEFQRLEIQQAFGAPVRNTYGCREFMLIAAEHAECGRMHINTDQLHVETVALEGGVDMAVDQIVITDLSNRGMPMIRYANGDIGAISSSACSCRLNFPVLDRIDGRRLDLLHTPRGKTIHFSAITYVFLDVPGVAHYQTIQRSLERLEILLVPEAGYGEASARQILDEIRRVIGEPMDIRITLVDSIAPGKSGKFRITRSELGQWAASLASAVPLA